MPNLAVENRLLFKNDLGLRFGDDYDRGSSGRSAVTNEVFSNNHAHNVCSYAVFLDGPKPHAIDVFCSMVDTTEWNEMGCVRIPEPGLEIQCIEQRLGPRIRQ
jgi:hypothetical protein